MNLKKSTWSNFHKKVIYKINLLCYNNFIKRKLNCGKERICLYLAAIIENGVFGDDIPEVDGSVITFTSQAGEESFQINDDGSIDVLWDDADEYNLDDFGFESYDELNEFMEDNTHFDSIRDIADAGFSWLMCLPDEAFSQIDKIVAGELY